MGKHTAQSRLVPQLRRMTANAWVVLLVTGVTALVVYIGIAAFATAKDNEIPPPTAAAFSQTPDASAFGTDDGSSLPAADPSGQAGALRTCPATGCTASTCHAETGEPPPHR